MSISQLPITEIRAPLRTAAAEVRRVVVEAPTGSGKSTQVPQFLLDDGIAGHGEVIVLQPRRIAARMLARRVAKERSVPLGSEVGYQVRFDKVVSANTRIRYVTEGILMRRLLSGNDLRDVGAIVFDEFHERHLEGDVCLALAKRLQESSRGDLFLCVMSATLDSAGLTDYLKPCSHLKSDGRTFPVEIRYAPQASGRDAGPPVWEKAANAAVTAANGSPGGDILIFMPGAYEISRTLQELDGQRALRDWNTFALHGELSPEQQDAAVDSRDRRKVVVSTNVAETSLTIDGITTVIDCGLARIPEFDPHRGINTLLVRNISQASADQRAGRAGRTAPGTCVRLWSEREHAHRHEREAPEIQRLDLAELLLMLKAHGITDPLSVDWMEPPDAKALDRAELLLADLGATVAEGGKITPLGEQMAEFPAHPRYARLILEGARRKCLPQVTMIAGIAQGRNFLQRLNDRRKRDARDDLLGVDEESAKTSDFFVLLRAYDLALRHRFDGRACREWGIHGLAARQAGQTAKQLLDTAKSMGLAVEATATEPEALRKCIMAGFIDQLARRLDSGTYRCDIIHGRRGELRRESVVTSAPLLVSAEIEERDLRGDVTVLLGLNTAVDEAWLKELYPDAFTDASETVFDTKQKRVASRVFRKFRDLILAERDDSETVDLDAAAAILADQVEAGTLPMKAWDERVEAWIRRVNFVAGNMPALEIEPIRPEDRRLLLEQALYTCTSARDVRERDVWPTLKDWLTAEQLACLDVYAPDRLPLPNSRRGAKIRYEESGRAVVSATVQHLYDQTGHPQLCEGRADVVVEILAPNQRPIQLTSDLGAFWTQSYPDVKKQLKGRYPKHEWR